MTGINLQAQAVETAGIKSENITPDMKDFNFPGIWTVVNGGAAKVNAELVGSSNFAQLYTHSAAQKLAEKQTPSA